MAEGANVEVACLCNGRDLYIHRKRGIQMDAQDFDVVADDNLRATDCDPSVSIRTFGELLSGSERDCLGLARVQ